MLRFEKILHKDKKDYGKQSSCVIARILRPLVISCIATTYQ